MPADDLSYYCWDGDPSNGIAPHRPSVAQLGDDDKEDEPEGLPDPRFGNTAAASNQRARVIAGESKVADRLRITVRLDGSSDHFVHSVSTPRTNFGTGDITLARPSTGVVELTWAADSFPPALTDPIAGINGASPGMASAEVIANGVRVHLSDGSAANLPFTVHV